MGAKDEERARAWWVKEHGACPEGIECAACLRVRGSLAAQFAEVREEGRREERERAAAASIGSAVEAREWLEQELAMYDVTLPPLALDCLAEDLASLLEDTMPLGATATPEPSAKDEDRTREAAHTCSVAAGTRSYMDCAACRAQVDACLESADVRREERRAATPEPIATLCGKYLGDNDGTCPQLTCIRRRLHSGDCDNVCGDGDAAPEPRAVDDVAMAEAGARVALLDGVCEWLASHGHKAAADEVFAERSRWYYPEHPEHWQRDEGHIARATTPEPSAVPMPSDDLKAGDVVALVNTRGVVLPSDSGEPAAERDAVQAMLDHATSADRAELERLRVHLAALRRVAEAARDCTSIALNDAGPHAFACMQAIRDALAAYDAAKGGE